MVDKNLYLNKILQSLYCKVPHGKKSNIKQGNKTLSKVFHRRENRGFANPNLPYPFPADRPGQGCFTAEKLPQKKTF